MAIRFVPPNSVYVKECLSTNPSERSFMLMMSREAPLKLSDEDCVVMTAVCRDMDSRDLCTAMEKVMDGYMIKLPPDAGFETMKQLALHVLECYPHSVYYVNYLGRKYMSASDMWRDDAHEVIARERTKQMQLEVEILKLQLELAHVNGQRSNLFA